MSVQDKSRAAIEANWEKLRAARMRRQTDLERDRKEEEAAIAAYILNKGVTQCPPAPAPIPVMRWSRILYRQRAIRLERGWE